MPKAILLTKDQILNAMKKTMSNRAAARYAGVSFDTFKKYAQQYKNEDGVTLWEAHKNQNGHGIPKIFSKSTKGNRSGVTMKDILDGTGQPHSFTPAKIKERLIIEGLVSECCEQCGYQERRVIDYKVPLLFHFKDNNKRNFKRDNIELLCYNCYFISVGDVFDERQVRKIEENLTVFKAEDPDWQLDEYQTKRMEELGLFSKKDMDNNRFDGSDLISRR